MKKPKERKGKIIFIDAKEEIRIERSAAYLKPEHIKRISDSYWKFKDVEGFAKTVDNKEVLTEQKGNLSIQLYVKQSTVNNEHKMEDLIAEIKTGQKKINASFDNLFAQLKNIGIDV